MAGADHSTSNRERGRGSSSNTREVFAEGVTRHHRDLGLDGSKKTSKRYWFWESICLNCLRRNNNRARTQER